MQIKKLSIEKLKAIVKTLRFMAKHNITNIVWKDDDKDILILDWSETKQSITINRRYTYKRKH